MRDNMTERLLEKLAVNYEFKEGIPLSDVHMTDVARHNIRPIGIDDEVVQQYQLAMEEGAEFPPIVIYPKKQGFGILSGCHRVSAAALAKRTDTSAYVATLSDGHDDRLIEVLQRVLNTVNGANYGKEERIQHAVRIHVGLGYSIIDTARMMGIRQQTLGHRIGAIKARERIEALGLHVDATMTDTTLNELGRVRNPDLLKSAVQLAQQARMTADQTRAMSQDLRIAVNDSEAHARMTAWQTKMSDVVKETLGGKYAGPTSPARKAVTYLDRLDRETRKEKFQPLTPMELKKALASFDAAIRLLQRRRAEIAALVRLTVIDKKRRKA